MTARRITADEAGCRLDVFLTRLAGITRSRAQALIAGGHVLINGASPKKSGLIIANGDELMYDIPYPSQPIAMAQAIALDIVYEDNDLIVINKARGMVVHPAAGHADGTLVNALLAHCGDLSGIGGQQRPGIVHRLDKETTGLLVAAKHDRAHNGLSSQLKARSMSRAYAALAYGHINDDAFIIDRPIGRHRTDRKKMAVVANGRNAVTHGVVWERLRASVLLGLRLKTGRTHQIRVHLQSIGHPLIGDHVYAHAAAQKHAPVLMLHACALSFVHPVSGQHMLFSAPPPDDFIAALRAFGWSGRPYWDEERSLPDPQRR